MGKDKKKKKYQSTRYPQKMMNEYADTLEAYTDIFDRFIIKDAIKEDDYKWALKTIRKAIKNLRKGNGDEVFDPERYEEIMYRDR